MSFDISTSMRSPALILCWLVRTLTILELGCGGGTQSPPLPLAVLLFNPMPWPVVRRGSRPRDSLVEPTLFAKLRGAKKLLAVEIPVRPDVPISCTPSLGSDELRRNPMEPPQQAPDVKPQDPRERPSSNAQQIRNDKRCVWSRPRGSPLGNDPWFGPRRELRT
jgi:hypothetical protein